jgi:hypothetical protein
MALVVKPLVELHCGTPTPEVKRAVTAFFLCPTYEVLVADARRAMNAKVEALETMKSFCSVAEDQDGNDMIRIEYDDKEGDTIAMNPVTFASWRCGERKDQLLKIHVDIKLTKAARRTYLRYLAANDPKKYAAVSSTQAPTVEAKEKEVRDVVGGILKQLKVEGQMGLKYKPGGVVCVCTGRPVILQHASNPKSPKPFISHLGKCQSFLSNLSSEQQKRLTEEREEQLNVERAMKRRRVDEDTQVEDKEAEVGELPPILWTPGASVQRNMCDNYKSKHAVKAPKKKC